MHRAIIATIFFCAASGAAFAQPVSPRIGPFVVDVRGVVPDFPSSTAIADSRGLSTTDLPGVGIGVDVGAHVYLFRWRAMTVGIGGELMTGRAHSSPLTASDGQVFGEAVSERFTTISPQISLNFGTSKGWSYLSAGTGQATWSIVPDTAEALPADEEQLKVFNYGG